ncbi:MAG: TRAP transporter small permease subunit [Guyparkeria sp.]
MIDMLHRLNRWIGLLAGAALLVMGGLILVEIVLRRTGGGFLGGTDEISGYVMAAIATWGFAYALTERAHVRIDLIQQRLAPRLRSLLDILALACLTGVAALVATYGWRVLATTLARGSRANTPLETPLWIPQSIWFAGWVWLTVTGALLLIAALGAFRRGRLDEIERLAGSSSEAGGAGS